MNVLLDLDGTLIDPKEGILQCIKFALSGLGEPCPSDDELKGYIGPPLHVSFGGLFGADSPKIAPAVALYRERFSAKGISEHTIYPEIPSALASLTALGAVLVVATSKLTVFAERIIENSDLARHIRRIYGSDPDGTRSDKAELISHVLKARGPLGSVLYFIGQAALSSVRGPPSSSRISRCALPRNLSR